jgi:hypothetical protein
MLHWARLLPRWLRWFFALCLPGPVYMMESEGGGSFAPLVEAEATGDPSSLSVNELKAALGEMGLETTGNKHRLLERLRDAREAAPQRAAQPQGHGSWRGQRLSSLIPGSAFIGDDLFATPVLRLRVEGPLARVAPDLFHSLGADGTSGETSSSVLQALFLWVAPVATNVAEIRLARSELSPAALDRLVLAIESLPLVKRLPAGAGGQALSCALRDECRTAEGASALLLSASDFWELPQGAEPRHPLEAKLLAKDLLFKDPTSQHFKAEALALFYAYAGQRVGPSPAWGPADDSIIGAFAGITRGLGGSAAVVGSPVEQLRASARALQRGPPAELTTAPFFADDVGVLVDYYLRFWDSASRVEALLERAGLAAHRLGLQNVIALLKDLPQPNVALHQVLARLCPGEEWDVASLSTLDRRLGPIAHSLAGPSAGRVLQVIQLMGTPDQVGAAANPGAASASALGAHLLQLSGHRTVRLVMAALELIADPSVLVVMFAVAACAHIGIFHAASISERQLPNKKQCELLPDFYRRASRAYTMLGNWIELLIAHDGPLSFDLVDDELPSRDQLDDVNELPPFVFAGADGATLLRALQARDLGSITHLHLVRLAAGHMDANTGYGYDKVTSFHDDLFGDIWADVLEAVLSNLLRGLGFDSFDPNHGVPPLFRDLRALQKAQPRLPHHVVVDLILKVLKSAGQRYCMNSANTDMVELITVYAPSDQTRTDIEKRTVDALAANVRRCHERKDGISGGGASSSQSTFRGGGPSLGTAGAVAPTPKGKIPKASAAGSGPATAAAAAATMSAAASTTATAGSGVVAGARAGSFRRTKDHYILGNMFFFRAKVDALLTSFGLKPYGRDENDHLVNIAYFLVGGTEHNFRMLFVDPALGPVVVPPPSFYQKQPGGGVPITACIDRDKSPEPGLWPKLFR